MLPRIPSIASTSRCTARCNSIYRVIPRNWTHSSRHSSTTSSQHGSPTESQPPLPAAPENTYFKITLVRSAIGLGSRKKGTLVSLGIHRRMQTVYHPHAPEFAGKILAVKELVKVENVPASAIRSKTEQRQERKASRGYVVLGNRSGGLLE